MASESNFQLRLQQLHFVGLLVLASSGFSLISGCGAPKSSVDSTSQSAQPSPPSLATPSESDREFLVSSNSSSVALRDSMERPAEGSRVARPYYSVPQLQDSLVIGLDADMSSGSAESGEAIRRGLELAIKEVNAEGGLLGKPVELIVRDHRGNPDRGVGNLAAFSEIDNLLAVCGGIHTPVAIRELEFVHSHEIVYLVPWAAGTPIVANGYSPNFVFRVSVRDEYAGGFLVDRALQRGDKKIGLLLERTSWGRSNEKAMKSALASKGLEPAGEEWFNWGERNLNPQVQRLADVGCDALLLVCNPLEGVEAVKAVANLPEDQRPAVVSHWGISGGQFFESIRPIAEKVDLSFLQTFSFLDPRFPSRVEPFANFYLENFDDCEQIQDIFAPVGTVHAYELVRMLAQVVRETQSTNSDHIREGLEALRNYKGIIRDYKHPFPVDHHDALDASDFILARFDNDGIIVPANEREKDD